MTAQISDTLILNGEKVSLQCDPPLPYNHPRITTRPPEDWEEDDRWCCSTACWRGYIATWEIRDNRLYLNGIRGDWRLLGDPLFADWVTDELIIPRGERLLYVHMGYGSVYAQEERITVEKGIVTQTVIINNNPKNLDPRQLALENLPGLGRVSRMLRNLEQDNLEDDEI